jgi:folate-dependent phosphoribosylglycinamide formyltransferase PurN
MTAQPVFNPEKGPMKYACGVSGSGSNYERIYDASPGTGHVVFSNTPECGGVAKAAAHKASLALLDSHRYFGDMWGLTKIPRHGVERDSFDKAIMTIVEQQIHGIPDLICLAGYDLWIGSWMVDRYFPRILNVHPGTSKYPGLGWRPTAKAILEDVSHVKSTVFFVDASDDGGPVLIQSASIPLSQWDSELREIRKFADRTGARTLASFREASYAEGNALYRKLETASSAIQEVLKVEGDWKIYPFAVHELIGRGRVALDGRTVYIDGVAMPENGWQVDRHGYAPSIK